MVDGDSIMKMRRMCCQPPCMKDHDISFLMFYTRSFTEPIKLDDPHSCRLYENLIDPYDTVIGIYHIYWVHRMRGGFAEVQNRIQLLTFCQKHTISAVSLCSRGSHRSQSRDRSTRAQKVRHHRMITTPCGRDGIQAYSTSVTGSGSTDSHFPDPKPLFESDAQMAEYAEHFDFRLEQYNKTLMSIEMYEDSLEEFSKGFERFGFTLGDGCTVYREWAPGAMAAELIGDFNDWNGMAMTRDDFGVWSVEIPDGT